MKNTPPTSAAVEPPSPAVEPSTVLTQHMRGAVESTSHAPGPIADLKRLVAELPFSGRNSASSPTIKLSDICSRLDAAARDVLYALTLQFAPSPEKLRTGSGHHRCFSPREVMGLALILQLKTAGMSTPKAAAVAKWFLREFFVEPPLRMSSRFSQAIANMKRPTLRIADAVWVQIGDGNDGPSPLELGRWVNVATEERAEFVAPMAIVVVDIRRIFQKLHGWALPACIQRHGVPEGPPGPAGGVAKRPSSPPGPSRRKRR